MEKIIKRRACPKCKQILNEKICPDCNATTKETWSGFLGILDLNSKIAKLMNIQKEGKYALKVRG